MNILQVNTTDIGGGAARTAWKLFEAYQQKGCHSTLAVGFKRSSHPYVYEIRGARRSPSYANVLWRIHGRLQPFETKVRGVRTLRDLLRTKAAGESLSARLKGRENFHFPESHRLLEMVPEQPDIVHCHNLHGCFFDLRFLTALSHHVPLVLTLHDAWLLSGHCAHSFACERWRTGCGQCPDLSIYPSLLFDGTAANWCEKQRIFERSRLHVATPSRWLMTKVEQSILNPVDFRVIPNGVDLAIFKPGNSEQARRELGLSTDVDILLYVGSSSALDSFKDFDTLRRAVLDLSDIDRRLWLICLGEKRPTEFYNHVAILYQEYVTDESRMALYYQAADICVHAAKAENFPYVVLEAMACGTPVIATSIGGIPEQIQDGETGMLVPPQDVEALTRSIRYLLNENYIRAGLATRAALQAQALFDLDTQANAYLSWYSDILALEHPL